jgi:hypothetical protein
MFIAHLPAGYLLSKALARVFDGPRQGAVKFMCAGMLGAVAPDIDMLYFYLVDHRRHHHHAYWTHFPSVWLTLLAASFVWYRIAGKTKPTAALAVIFSLNGIVHLLLDTVVGDIRWLAPFADKPFSLFTVPNLYKPWWLNFMLHWSFALELAVACTALFVLWRGRNKHAPG